MADQAEKIAVALYGQLPTEKLPDRQEVCARVEHGAFTSTGYLLKVAKPPREVWSKCPDCEREAREAQQALNEARERGRLEQVRHEQIRASGIPLRFHDRTLDNFKASTPAQIAALTAARDFAEQFVDNYRNGRSLILSGKPGTGKSHLAAGIALHVMDRFSVRYVTCMDLIREIRATWRRESAEGETEALDRLGETVGLLLIDEVGVQNGTENEQHLLFDVLDRRYRNMLPTILLTNRDMAGLKAVVGDRILDRLTEVARWIPFEWESYRPTARRESA